MPTAYHVVHYRRFDAGAADLNGTTLEHLCRTALAVVDGTRTALWKRAQDRVFDLGDSEGRQILLNKVADLTGGVFGEVCLMQRGGLQALLELTASTMQLSEITTAQFYNLSERTAPTGSQFIRGMVYWLAIGNHIFLVKTQSMTADYLQSYFKWLLTVRTPTVGEDVTFRLRNRSHPPPDQGGGSDRVGYRRRPDMLPLADGT